MRAKRSALLGVWLIAIIICAAVVARTRIRTDMTAFLPHSASLADQVLMEQVKNGSGSRLILLAVEGAQPETLAKLSKSLAARLRKEPALISVSNGDQTSLAGMRRFFWKNRYLLSPDVTARRFTAHGLHAALESDLGLLDSDMGTLFQQILPSDPTGELLTLMQQLRGTKGPHARYGVWFSAKERRALLMARTRAPGFDIDAQQRALATINHAFRQAANAIPDAAHARLLETGPAVFSVSTRDTIKRDATRLSLLAMAVVVSLLLFAYRSPRVLFLGALPVASGALAGIAAVSLDFGFIHGITLGFGVTLLGESIDYAIYLFTQTGSEDSASGTLGRIWPTLRLGALTSITGFSVMLFSRIIGFAQLGLFSITGLVAAACVTRFILPHLVPKNFFAAGAGILGRPLLAVIRRRQPLRIPVALLALAGVIALISHRGRFWDEDLSNLSPIPAAELKLNADLRRDMGVPNLRYFVVFHASDEQRALEKSARITPILRHLVAQHVLGGFAAPSQLLPSNNMQRQRQAALPSADVLRARFSQALAGTPFRPNMFEPFFNEVAAARRAPLLTPAALPATLRVELRSMLFPRSNGWDAIVPLRDVSDPTRIAEEIAKSKQRGLQFVDLNRQTDQLLRTYQRDATMLASIGSLAIVVLLLVGLRSLRRVIAVMAPLAASVILTAAILTADGGKLSIFMVVGFLLIAAVGSNYCLFFECQHRDPESENRSTASIVLANLCTVSAYGVMSFSHIPVLHDIGVTVAIGTFLSLLFSAVLSTSGPAGCAATKDNRTYHSTLLRKGRDDLPLP
jgi:predicted exporter